MQKLYMYLPKIYSKEKLDINFRNLYTKEKQKNLEYEKTYLHPTSLRHNLRRNCFHPRRKIFLASALHSSRYRIDFYFDSYKSNITIKRLWCCLRINYRILHNPFRSINRFHPRGPSHPLFIAFGSLGCVIFITAISNMLRDATNLSYDNEDKQPPDSWNQAIRIFVIF